MPRDDDNPNPSDLHRHFFGPSEEERRRIERSEYDRRRSEWRGVLNALYWVAALSFFAQGFSPWFVLAFSASLIAIAVIANKWGL
jgi:hypothetical protein